MRSCSGVCVPRRATRTAVSGTGRRADGPAVPPTAGPSVLKSDASRQRLVDDREEDVCIDRVTDPVVRARCGDRSIVIERRIGDEHNGRPETLASEVAAERRAAPAVERAGHHDDRVRRGLRHRYGGLGARDAVDDDARGLEHTGNTKRIRWIRVGEEDERNCACGPESSRGGTPSHFDPLAASRRELLVSGSEIGGPRRTGAVVVAIVALGTGTPRTHVVEEIVERPWTNGADELRHDYAGR